MPTHPAPRRRAGERLLLLVGLHVAKRPARGPAAAAARPPLPRTRASAARAGLWGDGSGPFWASDCDGQCSAPLALAGSGTARCGGVRRRPVRRALRRPRVRGAGGSLAAEWWRAGRPPPALLCRREGLRCDVGQAPSPARARDRQPLRQQARPLQRPRRRVRPGWAIWCAHALAVPYPTATRHPHPTPLQPFELLYPCAHSRRLPVRADPCAVRSGRAGLGTPGGACPCVTCARVPDSSSSRGGRYGAAMSHSQEQWSGVPPAPPLPRRRESNGCPWRPGVGSEPVCCGGAASPPSCPG